MNEKLLQVKGLEVSLTSRKGTYRLVEDVEFHINRGEVLGIVGESGCGKSVTAYSVLGLLESPPLSVTGGSILYEGRDLLSLKAKELREIRGDRISMIFQEPMTALDPLFTIGEQLMENLKIHRSVGREEMRGKVLEILRKVEIPRSESIVDEYPHQLSGGMLQRVVIALAMINDPALLIADEPTTALDVTIQAQILQLMVRLKEDFGTSIMMITHDLGVIAETCDRVAVFYGGHIVEICSVERLIEDPRHPYTRGLVESIRSLGSRGETLYSIPGVVPTYDRMGSGCRFASRCSRRTGRCEGERPPLEEIGPGHSCRCWLCEREDV